MKALVSLVLAAVLMLSGCIAYNGFRPDKCVISTAWTGTVDETFQAKAEKDIEIAATKKCELRVALNTPGGDVRAMLEVLRLMEKAKTEGMVIEIHGRQLVASAGALILAHGTQGKRFIAPGTFFLIHAMKAGGNCFDGTNAPKAGEKREIMTLFGPREVVVDEETAALLKFLVEGMEQYAKVLKVKVRCDKPYVGGPEVAVKSGVADAIAD